MTTTDDDDDRAWRRQVKELLRRDREAAPPFARVLAAARAGRPRPTHRWRLVASALVALGAVALIVFGRIATRTAPTTAVPIASWRSPTDFLLATPGRDLLRTVPAVGRPVLRRSTYPSVTPNRLRRAKERSHEPALARAAADRAPRRRRRRDASPADDPIARHVIPPELVMKHSQAIGVTSEQRETIMAAVQQAQSGFLDAQWQLQTEAGRLVELLQQRPVDEGKVLTQLDRILDLERRVKKLQFTLLIRIKNALTPSQLQRLEELRARP